MKKLIYILMAGAMLAISSCAKDGVNGTNGSNGTNASTAFQLSFSVPYTSWTDFGTSGTAGCGVKTTLQDTNLSFANVGQGAVLVYGQNANGNLLLLPYINYNTSGTQFTTQFWWEDGFIVIDVYNSTYTYSTFSSASNFIVVVIPGLKSLPESVDRNDYASVEAYYHPRKVN
jgi:hypothetical protein